MYQYIQGQNQQSSQFLGSHDEVLVVNARQTLSAAAYVKAL
jgi:hypothetical protein